jgi:hypothetical protein
MIVMVVVLMLQVVVEYQCHHLIVIIWVDLVLLIVGVEITVHGNNTL